MHQVAVHTQRTKKITKLIHETISFCQKKS